MPAAREHGRDRVERVLVVVVAADHDDARAGRAQREQRVPDDPLRFGRRRGGLEQVAGDEHEVDRLRRPRCPAISASTARCSSSRDAPRSVLPTCQSEVWRILIGVRPADAGRAGRRRDRRGSAAAPVAAGFVAAVSDGPGRPRRERELGDERHRDLRLHHEHRAGLGDRRPLLVRRRQEAVLGPRRLGRIEAADDADRRVGDDAPLDLARGLLRADQHDAERAAALGDVEEDLLDRRLAVARRVLVQLVEHDEQQRLGRPGLLLAVERAAQRDADDEALGAVGEVVQVDDRDLRVVGLDAVARALGRRRRARCGRASAATTAAGARTR